MRREKTPLRVAALLLGAAWLLPGCVAPTLTIEDVAILPDQPTLVTVYLEREVFPGFRDGVENYPIEFIVDDEVIAEIRTNENGSATLKRKLDLSPDASIRARTIAFPLRLESSARVYRWQADRTIVMVDIDDTVAHPDYDDLFFDAVDKDSHPVAGSHAGLNALAEHFHIAYLTGRPRFTLEKTHAWLETHGYPDGPVYTAEGFGEAIRHPEFKKDKLDALKSTWPNLLIGIGDRVTDLEAYDRFALLPLLCRPWDNEQQRERYGRNGLAFDGWSSLVNFFDANGATLRDPGELNKTLRRLRLENVFQLPAGASSDSGKDAAAQ
jgi:hypothetical protein